MKIIGQMRNNTQVRTFADITKSRDLSTKLMASSRSPLDAETRVQAYNTAYENLLQGASILDRKARNRFFSATGAGLGDLSGINPNQFIDVSVIAMIKSIAGFLAVERGVEQPTVKLPFVNLVASRLGKTDPGYVISPNIGPDVDMSQPNWKDQRKLSSAVIKHANTFTASEQGAVFNAAKALVPRSLTVSIVKGGKKFTLTDDGEGNVVGPAFAKLGAGSINYQTGAIEFEFATGEGFNSGDSYSLSVTQDTPKDPSNRVKGELDFYDIQCAPEIIIAEHNFINNLVAQKSLNIDMQEVVKKRVMDEYLKIVNRSVVDPIIYGYEGNSVNVDLSAYSITTNTFESYLQMFTHHLNKVDTALTRKSFKSVNTSAYLVGERVAETFKSMTRMGSFVLNTSASYIEDLVGHYNGIPVVKSHYVDPDTGYAIHKTADGQMAPVCRAIFLPVNDLPEIGNYNNPTQSADGIYSYEGSALLTSELVQKFTVTQPTGL